MEAYNINRIHQEAVRNIGFGVALCKPDQVESKDVVAFLNRQGNLFIGFANRNGSNLRVKTLNNEDVINKTTISGELVLKFDQPNELNLVRWEDIDEANFNISIITTLNVQVTFRAIHSELLAIRKLQDAISDIVNRLVELNIEALEGIVQHIDNL